MHRNRAAVVIYAAGFVRSATVSLVGVTLAIHLADVGFSTTQIGLLIGVGLFILGFYAVVHWRGPRRLVTCDGGRQPAR